VVCFRQEGGGGDFRRVGGGGGFRGGGGGGGAKENPSRTSDLPISSAAP